MNPESPGRIPTRSWYALRYKGQFRIGFTLNTSIGQGAVTVTPLQLALAYGALANGGTLYLPQLVRAVETSDGAIVQDFPPRVRHKAAISPGNLARVNDALYAVVNDPKGTAFPVRDENLDVAGKTGTAQTGSVATKDVDAKTAWYLSQTHAWFAAFSPSKDPEVAVVVLIEHGGSGPTVAAPLAMQMIREYERASRRRAPAAPPARAGQPPQAAASRPAPPSAAAQPVRRPP